MATARLRVWKYWVLFSFSKEIFSFLLNLLSFLRNYWVSGPKLNNSLENSIVLVKHSIIPEKNSINSVNSIFPDSSVWALRLKTSRILSLLSLLSFSKELLSFPPKLLSFLRNYWVLDLKSLVFLKKYWVFVQNYWVV